MNSKQRNIVKWFKTYVAKNNITAEKLIADIPYQFVAITPELIYDGKRQRCPRLKAINAWLRQNVNRDRMVYCMHVNCAIDMAVFYDNSLWQWGEIFGIAFQHDSDAVLFRLMFSEIIT